MSYDKVKHIVEVDENILAVFVIDSVGKISDLFIAADAKIDSSFVETVRSTLNLSFEIKKTTDHIGEHMWDILEYDKIRVIKIYESNSLIIVLAKSHTSPGDIAESVLGYFYESDKQESPPCLF
jgi:hypothetical protein